MNRAFAGSFARALPRQTPHVDDLAICIWCGASATCWDHLFPLVIDGRWSEFPEVLMPACERCNERRRTTRDPLDSIPSMTWLSEPDATRGRVEAVIAQVEAGWTLSSEARRELDDLYGEYERLLDRLRSLDQDVRKWAKRRGARPGA